MRKAHITLIGMIVCFLILGTGQADTGRSSFVIESRQVGDLRIGMSAKDLEPFTPKKRTKIRALLYRGNIPVEEREVYATTTKMGKPLFKVILTGKPNWKV